MHSVFFLRITYCTYKPYCHSQEQVDSSREEKMKQKLKDNLKIYEEILDAKRYTRRCWMRWEKKVSKWEGGYEDD